MILVDTHVAVWLLQRDSRLGPQAQSRLREADGNIGISAITPWEISMLAAKGRLELGKPAAIWVDAMFAMPGIVLLPIEAATAVDAGQLPMPLHGDPADRLIIATARAHGCLLMTGDDAILRYAEAGHVQTINARH